MSKVEIYSKYSANDLKRMWRTLEAEQGSKIVKSPYPGCEDSTVKYWMDLMEKRLQEEIASRPSRISRLLKRIKNGKNRRTRS